VSRELVEALAAKAPKESTATSNGAGKIAPGKVEEFLACVMTEHRGRMYWNGGVSIADLFATSALYESGSRLEPSYWIGKTSGSREARATPWCISNPLWNCAVSNSPFLI